MPNGQLKTLYLDCHLRHGDGGFVNIPDVDLVLHWRIPQNPFLIGRKLVAVPGMDEMDMQNAMPLKEVLANATTITEKHAGKG